jgi:hypothetical protein
LKPINYVNALFEVKNNIFFKMGVGSCAYNICSKSESLAVTPIGDLVIPSVLHEIFPDLLVNIHHDENSCK